MAGYFRPPIERPPINNTGFQPSAVNTLPAGAPISGDLCTYRILFRYSC